jgi:hypothetical protein
MFISNQNFSHSNFLSNLQKLTEKSDLNIAEGLVSTLINDSQSLEAGFADYLTKVKVKTKFEFPMTKPKTRKILNEVNFNEHFSSCNILLTFVFCLTAYWVEYLHFDFPNHLFNNNNKVKAKHNKN